MKTLIVLLTLSLSLCGLSAADSIRFAETLKDVRVCTVEDGERSCDIVARDTGSFSARLTIPGLKLLPIDEFTQIEMYFGDLSWVSLWGDVHHWSSNRTTYVLYEYDDDDHIIYIGTVTFTRSGDVLTISATAMNFVYGGLVAEDGNWDEHGRGTVPFSILIRTDDVTFAGTARTIYYKATTTQTHPRDPEAEPLVTVKVSGSADFTKPTVTIKSPRNRVRTTTTNEIFNVVGTAKDNTAVDHVLFRVGTNDWLTADGTTNWTAQVELPVGTNSVQVKSMDLENQESLTAKRTIVRKP